MPLFEQAEIFADRLCGLREFPDRIVQWREDTSEKATTGGKSQKNALTGRAPFSRISTKAAESAGVVVAEVIATGRAVITAVAARARIGDRCGRGLRLAGTDRDFDVSTNRSGFSF